MSIDPQTALLSLLDHAKKAGADAADVILFSRTSLSVERRLGRTENLERSESRDLGLRVFVGQKAASVAASALEPAQFGEIAERAVFMAHIVPDDPFTGLADEATTPDDPTSLDLDDGYEPPVTDLLARADEAEEAAMAVKGVTNSEGGSTGYSRSEVYLATSKGFLGHYARSNHAISASVLAGTGTGMQRDYDYHSAVYFSDLDGAAKIGNSAGEKAVARLNPIRVPTTKLPVVFDPRIATSLLGHLLGAINGASIVRGTSFLKDAVAQQIFAPGISIYDDPRRVRGMRSGTFDGEGVPTAKRAIIEDGVLTGWILDSRSARALKLESTGHASRGTGGPPSPSSTNLYMAAGSQTPEELIGDISYGIYVTELIGMGVNGLTGDYSRGAAGFLIRQGKLAEPVAEITIAGNLKQMFATLTPANNLIFRRGTDAPTIRIAEMTLAGA